MKKNHLLSISAAIAMVIATASFAIAGTVVVLKSESVATGGGDAMLYVDKDKLRIDSNENGQKYSVIYKTGGEGGMTYWIIDHGKNSYTEITPEDMKKIQSQVEESMKAVHKRMDSMPPSKRAEVEKVYQRQLVLMGRGGQFFLYDEVATGAKVGEWSTTQYAGKIGDEKLEDVWAATWQELGAPKEDFAVVTHMAEIFSSAGQKMPAFFQFGRIKGSDAFPIMVVTYENGAETERSQAQSVSQQDLDPSIFELPAGLTKNNPSAPQKM